MTKHRTYRYILARERVYTYLSSVKTRMISKVLLTYINSLLEIYGQHPRFSKVTTKNLKCHYDKNCIFSIEVILKLKQVACMRRKIHILHIFQT